MALENLSVLKFGGSSLATPEQIKSVAKKITDLHKAGKKLIVVTSAMGKTTDQLTELAYKVSSSPNRREFDMLLTTGERVSMALMSMALHDLKCPSISFTGSQAGIMTDGAFSNARIKEIKPFRVEEALQANKVVVLAGFQGVDPVTKEVTTLGRGGSDTTAVAMAAHFKADRCEILKDVDGVYAADPKIVPSAKLHKKLPVQALFEFCFWGAKVLNYRSVELARDRQVPLFVGRSDNFTLGTEITTDSCDLREGELLGVNSHKHVLEISVQSSSHQESVEVLENTLRARELPMPQILSAKYSNGICHMILASDEEIITGMCETLRRSPEIQILRDNVSTVTASFAGGPCQIHIVPSDQREAAIQKYF